MLLVSGLANDVVQRLSLGSKNRCYCWPILLYDELAQHFYAPESNPVTYLMSLCSLFFWFLVNLLLVECLLLLSAWLVTVSWSLPGGTVVPVWLWGWPCGWGGCFYRIVSYPRWLTHACWLSFLSSVLAVWFVTLGIPYYLGNYSKLACYLALLDAYLLNHVVAVLSGNLFHSTVVAWLWAYLVASKFLKCYSAFRTIAEFGIGFISLQEMINAYLALTSGLVLFL